MTPPEHQRWLEALRDILERSHLWTPVDVAPSIGAAVARLGLTVRIWLIDYEQVALHALLGPGEHRPDPVPVDDDPPGRAFALIASTPATGDPGGSRRWWVPVVDGTDRLGLLEVVLPVAVDTADDEILRHLELLAGLIGHLITAVCQPGDHIDRLRRTRPMSTASELLWRQVPPLTSSTDRVVVSAVLQPCYEVGGDGFDYMLDDHTACLVILDAVGHGLAAGLACAVALAAVRAARNAGLDLAGQARAADTALTEQFPDARFATAVLAELDLAGGRLRHINAGHPAPLLLRGGRLVGELQAAGRMPLGLGDTFDDVAEQTLEPGDRLLFYTDGVTEARAADGDRFGLERLTALIEQHEAAGLPAPETLRRLAHAVVGHQAGPPADDATVMLVQWSTPAAENTVPKAAQTPEKD